MWVTKALQQEAAFLAFVPKSRHSCVAKSATSLVRLTPAGAFRLGPQDAGHKGVAARRRVLSL